MRRMGSESSAVRSKERGARAAESTTTRSALRRVAVLLGALMASLSISATAAVAAAPTTPLPDGRGWEMVSPAEKGGATIDPLGFGVEGLVGGLIVSSEDGNALTYVATAPVTSEPEGNRAIEGNQVLAKRTSAGWSAKDIVTPHVKGEGLVAGTDQEYRLFSPDLSLALVAPFGFQGSHFQEPPLVAGATSEERSVYLRHTSNCETSLVGCYEPIVTEQNVTGTTEGAKTRFGGEILPVGASPDLNHEVVKSPLELTTSTAPEGGLYEWNAGQPAGSQLQLISIVPPPKPGAKSKVALEPELGNNVEGVSSSARNAVSDDGSRVFWSGLANEKAEAKSLYMRDTTTGQSVQVNAEEGFKAKGTKTAQTRYQIASTDGTRVFFTDTAGLTSDSKLTGKQELEPADLYVCELAASELTPATTQCPKGKLTDLTGEKAGFTGPGDVVGEVLGASADGTTVYFAANGAITGGTTGTCPNANNGEEPSATKACSLYVEHFNGSAWEAAKQITTLSSLDSPDWGTTTGMNLWNLTARVSSDGSRLAFMSERPLTGYDNRDAAAAAHEAKDEEVFLYDSGNATAPIVCASCNPNPAQRPTGVFDAKRNSGEGAGLVVDPAAKVWEGRWLAGSIPGWTALSTANAPYQSRYLLDDGRLYFNSADALVSGDTNKRTEQVPKEGAPGETEAAEVGVEDVYQYEPGGVGSCEAAAASCVSLLSSGTSEHESAFMDASTSGNDVFFLTGQALVSSDIDSVFDAYDARVCTESSPCITPPPPPAKPCNGEATCRTGAPESQTFGGTASESLQAVSKAPQIQTLPSKTTVTPKPLTRAQKLAKALKACKKNNKHSKRKRLACERTAHKKYGAKKASHKAGKK